MTISRLSLRIPHVLAFMLLCIAIAFPNAYAQLSSSEDENSNKLVNVQLKWLHQFQFAGYYMAIEKGYYQEHGLDVILHERKPGATPIDKLIYGSVDYAIGGVGALYYRANGLPLVALAAIFQHSPSTLVSRYEDMNSLRGKKVMLSKGVMNAEIIAMLLANNITKEDIELVPSNQSMQGFINGDIDAFNGYITNEPFQLQKHNVDFSSFYPKDHAIDFYGDILLTTEKQVSQNPEEVALFRQASLRGWQYALDNVDETIDVILAKYNSQGKSRELLTFEARELNELIHSDIVPIGYMSEERWLDIAKVLNDVADLDFDNSQLEHFLYSKNRSPSFAFFIRHNFKGVVIFICTLLGLFLLWHNYHLKMTVKSRTLQLSLAREQAEIDARTDSLTGLSNRRCFLEIIDRNFAIAQRNKLTLSLISLDIDWFKKVNDSYGHDVGDLALKHVAHVIERNIRTADTLARVGGEEFVILCLDQSEQATESSDITQLAERIRKDVQQSPLESDGHSIAMTISIGIAQRQDQESIDSLLKRADEALYNAKTSGRNNVCCAPV